MRRQKERALLRPFAVLKYLPFILQNLSENCTTICALPVLKFLAFFCFDKALTPGALTYCCRIFHTNASEYNVRFLCIIGVVPNAGKKKGPC